MRAGICCVRSVYIGIKKYTQIHQNSTTAKQKKTVENARFSSDSTVFALARKEGFEAFFFS